VQVKPRGVAGRNLQLDQPHRAVLEQLAMVRLLMNGHYRHLPLARLIGRPPRRLRLQRDRGDECSEHDGRERHERT
jgi:hypothetical protein